MCKSQPTIKLDDKHYKLVDMMESLVDEYPSLLDCESLKVSGPVKFGRGVAIKGKVRLRSWLRLLQRWLSVAQPQTLQVRP